MHPIAAHDATRAPQRTVLDWNEGTFRRAMRAAEGLWRLSIFLLMDLGTLLAQHKAPPQVVARANEIIATGAFGAPSWAVELVHGL